MDKDNVFERLGINYSMDPRHTHSGGLMSPPLKKASDGQKFVKT